LRDATSSEGEGGTTVKKGGRGRGRDKNEVSRMMVERARHC
jgi:hypothetical protein